MAKKKKIPKKVISKSQAKKLFSKKYSKDFDFLIVTVPGVGSKTYSNKRNF